MPRPGDGTGLGKKPEHDGGGRLHALRLHQLPHRQPTIHTPCLCAGCSEGGGRARCQNIVTISHRARQLPNTLVYVQGGAQGSGQILWAFLVSCPRDILLSYKTRFCFVTCGTLKVGCERCAHQGWVFNQVFVWWLYFPLSELLLALKESRTQTCVNSSHLSKFNKADIYGFVGAETWHLASDCLDCGVSV